MRPLGPLGLLAGLALGLLAAGPAALLGCAPARDELALAQADSQLALAALVADSLDLEARVRETARQLAAQCAGRPDERECRLAAAQAAARQYEAEERRLVDLVVDQRAAAQQINRARRCRRDGAPVEQCEGPAVETARRYLSSVLAQLEREGRAP